MNIVHLHFKYSFYDDFLLGIPTPFFIIIKKKLEMPKDLKEKSNFNCVSFFRNE